MRGTSWRGGVNPGTVPRELRCRIGPPGTGRRRPAWRGLGCRTARPPRARRARCASADTWTRHASAGRDARFSPAGRSARLRPAGRGGRFPSAGRGARLRLAVARPRRGSCGSPLSWRPLALYGLAYETYFSNQAEQSICLCQDADAAEPEQPDAEARPRLDGAKPPLMLIHRAMTGGADGVMPYRQDLRGTVARSSLSRSGGNLPFRDDGSPPAVRALRTTKSTCAAWIVQVRGKCVYICGYCMPVPHSAAVSIS